MKFKDLVFLAEMNYGDIPGDVSQNVRDASLGDEPLKDTEPTKAPPPKPEKEWQHEDEFDTPEGLFIVRFDADYSDEVVDHDPGYPGGYGSKDIYASVPNDISDYEVVEIVDDEGTERPASPELEKKYLNRAWVKFSTNPDNYREVGSERDYDDYRDRDDY